MDALDIVEKMAKYILVIILVIPLLIYGLFQQARKRKYENAKLDEEHQTALQKVQLEFKQKSKDINDKAQEEVTKQKAWYSDKDNLEKAKFQAEIDWRDISDEATFWEEDLKKNIRDLEEDFNNPPSDEVIRQEVQKQKSSELKKAKLNRDHNIKEEKSDYEHQKQKMKEQYTILNWMIKHWNQIKR